MKMWGCDMDDPRIADMDPVRKLWMYEQWLGDQRDDAELAKNHAYLLGSFWNPEAVQSMMNNVVHESTEEDMQESMRMVVENDIFGAAPLPSLPPPKPIKRRKRRATLKEQQG